MNFIKDNPFIGKMRDNKGKRGSREVWQGNADSAAGGGNRDFTEFRRNGREALNDVAQLAVFLPFIS